MASAGSAAQRAQRIVVKETRKYLRGRTASSVVGELLDGVKAGGGHVADVPVYESETAALRAEVNGRFVEHDPQVIVLMCHEERDEVFALLKELGARPVDVADELTRLVPRLQDRPRRA